MSAVLRAKTPSFAHHNVAFSPFFEDRLALASGANFGLVGNGRVHILRIAAGLQVVNWYVMARLGAYWQVRYAGLRLRCRLE